LQERRLQHREQAERFYRDLAAQAVSVRVGMEASIASTLGIDSGWMTGYLEVDFQFTPTYV
jgi:hypothetical protein